MVHDLATPPPHANATRHGLCVRMHWQILPEQHLELLIAAGHQVRESHRGVLGCPPVDVVLGSLIAPCLGLCANKHSPLRVCDIAVHTHAHAMQHLYIYRLSVPPSTTTGHTPSCCRSPCGLCHVAAALCGNMMQCTHNPPTWQPPCMRFYECR